MSRELDTLVSYSCWSAVRAHVWAPPHAICTTFTPRSASTGLGSTHRNSPTPSVFSFSSASYAAAVSISRRSSPLMSAPAA